MPGGHSKSLAQRRNGRRVRLAGLRAPSSVLRARGVGLKPPPKKGKATPFLRALSLAEERFEEIALSHRVGTYEVPSFHGGHSYDDVAHIGREESCDGPDWQIRGAACYHVLAAVGEGEDGRLLRVRVEVQASGAYRVGRGQPRRADPLRRRTPREGVGVERL